MESEFMMMAWGIAIVLCAVLSLLAAIDDMRG